MGGRRELILLQRIPAMSEDHLGASALLKHMDLLITRDPVIMIPCQPTLGRILVVVLVDVVLIGSEYPGATLLEVYLLGHVSRDDLEEVGDLSS